MKTIKDYCEEIVKILHDGNWESHHEKKQFFFEIHEKNAFIKERYFYYYTCDGYRTSIEKSAKHVEHHSISARIDIVTGNVFVNTSKSAGFDLYDVQDRKRLYRSLIRCGDFGFYKSSQNPKSVAYNILKDDFHDIDEAYSLQYFK